MVEKNTTTGNTPEQLEELDRTNTEIDVVHTTQKNPYGEINFIGTYLAVLFGCNASFVGFLMPITSLQFIEAVLGVSPNVVWVSLAWTLSSALSFVLLGRLSDIFGRRWFFTGCSVSGLIGSIIGATANRIDILIAASVFLGLASSGQLSFNISLGELVPIRHRFAVNGIIFLSVLPFSGLGPYIARLIIAHTSAGFRGIYYLAISLNAASSILWVIFYHPPDFQHLHRNRTVMDEVKEMDFGGIFLYVAGFFLFLLESFMNLRRPLIPIHLFRKDFVVINVLNAVAGVIYYTANTLFPYTVAALYTTNIVKDGLVTSCVGGGVCAGQFIGSWIAVPGGMLKYKLIFISCGLCAFTACLAGAVHSQAIGSALAVCAGFMVGLLEIIIATAITIVIDDRSEIGAAGGIFGSIRSAAEVLATAIYASIYLNKSTQYTKSEVVPALLQAGLPASSIQPFLTAAASGSVPAVEQVPGVTPAILATGVAALTDAHPRTFKIVWLGTLAFGLLAVIASFFTSNIDEKLSHDVVKRLHGKQKEEDTEKHDKAVTEE